MLKQSIEESRNVSKLGMAILSLLDKLLRWTNVGLNLSTVSGLVSVESMQPVYLPYWVSLAVTLCDAWPRRCLADAGRQLVDAGIGMTFRYGEKSAGATGEWFPWLNAPSTDTNSLCAPPSHL